MVPDLVEVILLIVAGVADVLPEVLPFSSEKRRRQAGLGYGLGCASVAATGRIAIKDEVYPLMPSSLDLAFASPPAAPLLPS